MKHQSRNNQGQYKRKRRPWKRYFFTIAFFVLIIFIVSKVGVGKTIEFIKSTTDNTTTVVQEVAEEPIEIIQEPKVIEDDEVERVLSRAEFKARMRLEARKIALEEKKAALTTEFNTAIADIEAELEEVRAEELSFQ